MKPQKKMIRFCLTAALCALAGCAPAASSETSQTEKTDAGEISVMTREDGSGTRSAFTELFGIEEKQADGTRKDLTIPTAAVTSSTSVMLTNVASDPASIGYVSLGSLNDTVKGLRIDGAAPTAENIENGSYKISRPFNLVVNETPSKASQDFISFIMSQDGQTIVEAEGYIPVKADTAYQKSSASGKVVVSGSSSVAPLMEKLAETYQKVSPAVKVEIQQSDSSSGISDAADGISDLGMASRELKDEEKARGLTSEVLASDGIVVIVSPDNETDELASDTIRKIYTGEITAWDAVSR